MNITTLTTKDKHYPQVLKQIDSPPKQLFTLGQPIGDEPKLTVIGSRDPSYYGINVCQKIVDEISRAGVTVVSGLALGIDSIAHEACIKAGGKTIAVMPAGLDKIYPRSHANLAKKILASGGTLIAEYPIGTEPLKHHFINRNRICSGLSDGVLVIEAAQKSGTLITAQFAIDQNRMVMAVPGNINSKLSFGTNSLIKMGAYPITSASDVLELLNIATKTNQKEDFKAKNLIESGIVKILEGGSVDSSYLANKLNLPIAELMISLTVLEMAGIIKQNSIGNWELF
jgi:DNA processing protein